MPREVIAFPPADGRDALRRLQPALAFRQPAEREDTRQGIGEAAADLAEQALLVVEEAPSCHGTSRCPSSGRR